MLFTTHRAVVREKYLKGKLMRFQRLSTGVGLSVAAVLALSTAAKAASFTTNFTQSSGSDASQQDIWLNSITQNQVTFNDFVFVNKADILFNTPISDRQAGDTSNPDESGRNNNTGAASTDKGDKATAPLPVSGMNDPTGSEIAAYLGNRNLNNIIDTEDSGAFSMNLFFDAWLRTDNTGLDNIFFWERGMNSDLGVQAIDAAGKVIGNFVKLTRGTQSGAGYNIDTLEINGSNAPQQVGSWGLSLKQLGVSSAAGIRITADKNYNGPDFKVVARQSVPEPTTLAGLGLVAGALAASRRRQVSKAINR